MPSEARATVARNSRLRTTVGVLVLALLATGMYAHSQSERAAKAQRALRALQSAADARPAARGDRYPVALIGEDGSRRPLDGKALHIDLGGDRLLEIELARHRDNHLRMWAPSRREDKHVNVLVFHPYCANVFALELERLSRGGAESEGRVFADAGAAPLTEDRAGN